MYCLASHRLSCPLLFTVILCVSENRLGVSWFLWVEVVSSCSPCRCFSSSTSFPDWLVRWGELRGHNFSTHQWLCSRLHCCWGSRSEVRWGDNHDYCLIYSADPCHSKEKRRMSKKQASGWGCVCRRNKLARGLSLQWKQIEMSQNPACSRDCMQKKRETFFKSNINIFLSRNKKNNNNNSAVRLKQSVSFTKGWICNCPRWKGVEWTDNGTGKA